MNKKDRPHCDYQPRTPFGKRLMELRLRAIGKGMRLLTWDEIDEAVGRKDAHTETRNTDTVPSE
jgi:hypothetical protein